MGGSMVSKRLSIFGFISAAALVSGVLIGCGGSSASVSGATGTVKTTGGITTTTGTSTTPAPTSTSPQQVQVTTTSGPVTATVPPGQPAITTTTTLGIIPANTPFIAGATVGSFNKSSVNGKPLQTFTAQLNISYDNGNTWQWTGIDLNPDGSLMKNLALAAAETGGVNCLLQANGGTGGFNITSGNNTLTIGSLVYGVIVLSDGTIGLPTNLALTLPANSNSTANGNSVTATFNSEFAGYKGTLMINWPGTSKTQVKTLSTNAVAVFSDPLSDKTDTIPATGVTTVQFGLSQ